MLTSAVKYVRTSGLASLYMAVENDGWTFAALSDWWKSSSEKGFTDICRPEMAT